LKGIFARVFADFLDRGLVERADRALQNLQRLDDARRRRQ